MKGYDAWKLASPDDERRTYYCDCCGKSVRNIERRWTTGLEAWACPACRGESEPEYEYEGEE